MFAGVILAAGQSKRMGTPKAFLKWENSTFVETIVSRLKEAGVAGVFVVTRSETQAKTRALLQTTGAMVLPNDDPVDEGPISSIKVALRSVGDECWGIVVCPVDHPGVDRATYATLLQEAHDNPGQIIVPVCQGKVGHPVIFPAEVFNDLKAVRRGKGADAVIQEQAHRVVRVKVSDLDVLRDIDTREDYESATGKPLEEKK